MQNNDSCTKNFKKWNASKALMTGKGGTAHCLFEHIPLRVCWSAGYRFEDIYLIKCSVH